MSMNKGFTLIEVMVALAVFSVVSVALLKNTSASLNQSGVIKDLTIAWWLVENRMTNFRLAPRSGENYPNEGTSIENLEVNGTGWELETLVESTENDYVRRIVISVKKIDEEGAKAKLIGFLGR